MSSQGGDARRICHSCSGPTRAGRAAICQAPITDLKPFRHGKIFPFFFRPSRPPSVAQCPAGSSRNRAQGVVLGEVQQCYGRQAILARQQLQPSKGSHVTPYLNLEPRCHRLKRRLKRCLSCPSTPPVSRIPSKASTSEYIPPPCPPASLRGRPRRFGLGPFVHLEFGSRVRQESSTSKLYRERARGIAHPGKPGIVRAEEGVRTIVPCVCGSTSASHFPAYLLNPEQALAYWSM